jgi:hypothetical protein
MDRAISPNEVKVVKWLLDHALVEVTAYRLQPLEHLRVVGGCTCGCTTLHFKPLELLRGKKMLADELAIYPNGQQAGLILWGLEGEIVMLEVYDSQPGSPIAFQTSLTCVLGKIWDAEICNALNRARAEKAIALKMPPQGF